MFVIGKRPLPGTTWFVRPSLLYSPSQSSYIVVIESCYQAQKLDDSLSMRHIATYAIAP